jgi:Uma2 family endonuclease
MNPRMLTEPDVDYPDSDGMPIADNTTQYRWIVTIHGNLDCMFADDDNVFIAADLLWYPISGQPTIRVAPDVYAVLNRPKGDRGSYRQWLENDQPPHVVFEIRSPGNTDAELERKLAFYDRHGVEEYYLYDPDARELFGWWRVEGQLQPIMSIDGWASPLLGIRFEMIPGEELVIYTPTGERFLTFLELMRRGTEAREQADWESARADEAERAAADERRDREQAQRQAEQERRDREQAQRQAEEAQRQAEEARRRAEQLAERLRALGLDPES